MDTLLTLGSHFLIHSVRPAIIKHEYNQPPVFGICLTNYIHNYTTQCPAKTVSQSRTRKILTLLKQAKFFFSTQTSNEVFTHCIGKVCPKACNRGATHHLCISPSTSKLKLKSSNFFKVLKKLMVIRTHFPKAGVGKSKSTLSPFQSKESIGCG